MRKNHLAELTAEYEKSILFAIYHGHMVMEESLAGSGKFQCRKALGKRRRRRRDDLADLLKSTDCRVIAFEDDSVETVMFVALAGYMHSQGYHQKSISEVPAKNLTF